MTTTLGTKAGSKTAEKVVKHIDVNLEPCYSDDCAERCTVPGKTDTKKS
jgi:hypothetical protein